MATFFSSQNNGVIALIREDHAKRFGLVKRSGGDPFAVGVKVFTFCHADRLAENPEQRRIFSGTHAFCNWLSGGHMVLQCGDQKDEDCWSGFVPFSNQDFENLSAVTTPQDIVDIFGLTRKTDK